MKTIIAALLASCLAAGCTALNPATQSTSSSSSPSDLHGKAGLETSSAPIRRTMSAPIGMPSSSLSRVLHVNRTLRTLSQMDETEDDVWMAAHFIDVGQG